MSHPAMWLDPWIASAQQAVTELHVWLLAGWLGISLLVAWVVGGDGR